MARVVVLRPAPEGYAVDVDPPLPDGLSRARTFATKLAAWTYASALWRDHGLGLRDETFIGTSRTRSGPIPSDE